jgi:hypothetical protein
MATVTSYAQLTLLELARRTDPGGDMAVIAEILAKTNEVFLDAVWVQSNDVFSHKTTQRLANPAGAWRKLNAGVSREASQTIPITDTIGILESWSQVDKRLVEVAPNPAQFRMSEASSFIEGMGDTFASTLIYGDTGADPEKFMGLAPRMAALAATANVIGSGGTGSDVTSIYGVQWGENSVHMIYPKGAKTAVDRRDWGEQIVLDGSSNPFVAMMDQFTLEAGLAVRNPRSIFRLANIESAGSSNIFNEDNLIKLLNRMPMAGKGTVLYVNPTVKSQMEIALKDKANVWFNYARGEGLAGGEVLTFRGCPVRTVEAILDTETAIA